MKKIEAIIRRERLGPVRRALEVVGYPGMTLTEVKGHGKQKGRTAQGQGDTSRAEYLPKLKLEIVAHDAEVPAIMEAIISKARTGEIGDGKVFVSTIDTAVRVRTGEAGEPAL